MKKSIFLMMAVVAIFLSCTGPKPNSEPLKPKGADEKALSSAKNLLAEFKLSGEEQKMVEKADKSLNKFNCDNICCNPVAFSVFGNDHYTSGQDVPLEYNQVITNEGGGWSAGAPVMFIAPCRGLYYFAISFEKDAFYYGGTTDDVAVFLTKVAYGQTNGVYIGYAWSGEGDGNRGTGAYEVVLRLNVGDKIYTKVHSDGNVMRHLSYYNFSGYSIGK